VSVLHAVDLMSETVGVVDCSSPPGMAASLVVQQQMSPVGGGERTTSAFAKMDDDRLSTHHPHAWGLQMQRTSVVLSILLLVGQQERVIG